MYIYIYIYSGQRISVACPHRLGQAFGGNPSKSHQIGIPSLANHISLESTPRNHGSWHAKRPYPTSVCAKRCFDASLCPATQQQKSLCTP